MKITAERLDEVIQALKADARSNSFAGRGAKNFIASINESVEYKNILSSFIDLFYNAIKLKDNDNEIDKAKHACDFLMVYGSVLIEIGYHLGKSETEIYDAN